MSLALGQLTNGLDGPHDNVGEDLLKIGHCLRAISSSKRSNVGE